MLAMECEGGSPVVFKSKWVSLGRTLIPPFDFETASKEEMEREGVNLFLMQAKADWTGNHLYDIRYFARPGDTADAQFEFVNDYKDWLEYNRSDNHILSRMKKLGVKSFILHSTSGNPHYNPDYMIDFSSMTQRNIATRKMRTIREAKDPLESYVKTCREDPITASMLGESSDIFMCPILQDVPIVPVTASDGHMYDYDSIRAWMKQNDTSPMTKEKIGKELKPALRDRAVMESIIKKKAAKKKKLSSSKKASATSASSKE